MPPCLCISTMKYHDPTSDELKEMDGLLLEIKIQSFKLQTCIFDPLRLEVKKILLELIREERTKLIDKLSCLVKKWTHVPVCAACYLPIIPITSYEDEACDLKKMDELIMKIQYHYLYLKIYKREAKDDPKRKAEVDDTVMTKKKLIGQLRDLVKDWSYVPICAEDLLESRT